MPVAQENGVEALLEQGVHGRLCADADSRQELDSQADEAVHQVVYAGLRQLEAGDAVSKQAPGLWPRVQYFHRVAPDGQALGRCQTSRPRPDYGHAPSPTRCNSRPSAGLVALREVRRESLQPSDRHRPRLSANHARAFTKTLLGTEPPTDLGPRTGESEDARARQGITLLDLEQGPRDVVVEWACLRAGSGRALDAAVRLQAGARQVEPQADLFPVVDALHRKLLGDWLRGDLEPLLPVYCYSSSAHAAAQLNRTSREGTASAIAQARPARAWRQFGWNREPH